uniref:Origin recognition complex subunit 2 n=1 Tax=Oncorhynchus mykiss TaxID=8022 RepID=A0A8K9X113_ONCMY
MPGHTLGHSVPNVDISKLLTHTTPCTCSAVVRSVGRTTKFSKLTLSSLATALLDIPAVSKSVALCCLTKLHILEWPFIVPSTRCSCVMIMLFNQLLDMPALSGGWIILASLVEEYFEAHGSSKFLTSDRTLQRLHTPKLDRETLFRLLEGKPACYSSEIEKLHSSHHEHFNKWMLQLQLGYSVLLYGLGSKKALLEEFRVSLLCQEIHLVVNGFFPSISLKSILTALSAEILEHQGTFRNPADQLQYITTTLREQPDLHVYLLIHNIDGPMLRGGKTQNALGQLASLPNLHLVASIDHINAPLVWDQCKLSQFNWLWWECVCFQRYVEETSYENSLLVQQTGALALSSLTHVLRSLTANARGIFKLLVEFQLENKDNPSYTGLSFQDFYQRCREAFLVNSDLTLRTQLTEFRDHKLIRTRKGADGVEYLLVAVETSTLTDFLEKEIE